MNQLMCLEPINNLKPDPNTEQPFPIGSPRERWSISEETRAGMHRLKKIVFIGRDVLIAIQNENGPCALLALFNCMLLRGSIQLSLDQVEISVDRIVEMLADLALENHAAKNSTRESNDTVSNAIKDILEVLPTLQFGLGVNIGFKSTRDFVPDRFTAVFELLKVDLHHGWVVDPEQKELCHAIGDATYDELMDKVVDVLESSVKDSNTSSNSDSEDMAVRVHTSELIKTFLEETASQLTFEGLLQLHQKTLEHEVSVFFRNNHFSTMFRHQGRLFLLMTDQGYINNKSVAWESLDEISGDTELVSPLFTSVNSYAFSIAYTRPSPPGTPARGENTSLDVDEILAQQMHEQEMKRLRSKNKKKKEDSKANSDTSGEKSRGCIVM